MAVKLGKEQLSPEVKAGVETAAKSPEVSEKIAANLAAVEQTRREWAEGNKVVKLSAEMVPARASAENLPKKRYHVGTIPGAPYESMCVKNQDFPLFSSYRIPGGKEMPDQTIFMLGKVVEWDDEELEFVVRMAGLQAWRTHARPAKDGKERSSRWSAIDLTEKRNRFQPGDKLLASFIYIDELPAGKDVRPGLRDARGAYLPTPEPLFTE